MIVLSEIEVVLDERSAHVRVVTDAVATCRGKRSAEFVCSDENDPPREPGEICREMY